jgi:nucleotide-binding universal stress UspA family protein
MTMAFQRILCAVDFSDASREALHVATELARKSQAMLVVLHVAERAAPWTEAELAAWQQESRRRGVSEVAIKLRLGVAWDQIIGFARGRREDRSDRARGARSLARRRDRHGRRACRS